MRRRIQNILLIVLGLLCFKTSLLAGGESLCKTTNTFETFLLSSDAPVRDIQKISKYHAKYLELLKFFQEKQKKRLCHRVLLSTVFYKTHQKLLKQYKPYKSFESLFSDGVYGCLTGTAIYALLLEDLGYEYQIIESTYHVFLIVEVDGHKYAFESTDPLYGFITSEKEIEEKVIATQKFDDSYKEDGKYQFEKTVYQAISLDNLVGLQYYNFALLAYNKGDYRNAVSLLNEARALHPSDRMKEFAELMSEQIAYQKIAGN